MPRTPFDTFTRSRRLRCPPVYAAYVSRPLRRLRLSRRQHRPRNAREGQTWLPYESSILSSGGPGGCTDEQCFPSCTPFSTAAFHDLVCRPFWLPIPRLHYILRLHFLSVVSLLRFTVQYVALLFDPLFMHLLSARSATLHNKPSNVKAVVQLTSGPLTGRKGPVTMNVRQSEVVKMPQQHRRGVHTIAAGS